MKRIQAILFMLSVGLTLSTAVSVQALTFNALSQKDAAANQTTESWQGVLAIGDTRLRLVLNLTKAADGSLKATLDSPDQSVMGIPVDEVTNQSGSLHFTLKAIDASYDGTPSRDGSEMLGVWRQRGNIFSLILHRAGSAGQSVNQASTQTIRRGRVQLQSCGRAELPSDALCGKYEVFEDRAARTGRKISLNLLILPALSDKPQPEPVFYLAGGPGGAATSYAGAWFMTRLRRERDIVLVDQRGTGASNQLQCNLYGERTDMTGYFSDEVPVERLRACRRELEKAANLALYSTPIAMDDLDEVRDALGYQKINIYGGSYGTTAALSYLRQHPERVRTVAVFGVAPPDFKLPLSFAKGVQNAMDRLIEDCAADKSCHESYPNLRAEFDGVLAQLAKGPVKVTATNVATRKQQEITLSRNAFAEVIRMMLYVPSAMSVLPLLLHQAALGNFAPLITVAYQVILQVDGQIARGMQLSVVCAEDIPFITEEEIQRESAGTFYGENRVRFLKRACEEWPKGTVSPDYAKPVKATAPVLMISGEVDPVTPPWIAKAAVANLPNGRQVIIPHASHYTYECTENLIAEFIERGSAKDLNTSCTSEVKRLPFNTGK